MPLSAGVAVGGLRLRIGVIAVGCLPVNGFIAIEGVGGV